MRNVIDRLAEPQNIRRAIVTLCVLIGLAVALAAIAVVQATSSASRAKEAITRVEDGRKVGAAITCAATSAVIDAGRVQIRSSAKVRPAEFARELERLGLPRASTRAQLAEAAANLYARQIADKVVRESGVFGVVQRDGSLNCSALRRAAKIGEP